MATITNANSKLLLTVKGLFPTPVPIEGFSADDAFATEEIEVGETIQGVDGHLSAAYSPYKVPFEITLQADSLSNIVFDSWIGAEKSIKDKYEADLVVMLPGVGEVHTLKTGYLTKVMIMPSGKKNLEPRKFTIEFQDHDKGPI